MLRMEGRNLHCGGQKKGHWIMGRHNDGFDFVHGGHIVSQRSLEGRMLLEFCLKKQLCVSNAWFKRERNGKVAFRL